MDIERIENIYKRYGFEVKKEYDGILTFLYKKGRYFGVDIVPFETTEEVIRNTNKLQEEYSKLSFAVNIKSFSNEDEIETELYKSFFSYESTLHRLARKYSEFEKKQTKNLLGSKYQYIESPFELYNGNENGSPNGLLDTIERIVQRAKPQLIIIEAAAGYGKTCAAYEILNTLVQQKKQIITPLFTELSKNRGAKIFRYILLDEIDIEFPTLNSTLVMHEIKNGRIPLIIDGFDELIDKVNVTNLDTSAAFDEIETMLDTIGDLLENNAKVILTTRKTAIFSGIEFDKWLSKWNNKFTVSRLSLKEPRIKDWLGIDRFSIAKEKNIPIQYIANPVILTYLKNITDEDFGIQMENPDLLIRKYFEKMLDRERERQNLIITVDKQYEIFKNVAKMLLELDITVETKEFFKEIIKDQNHKLLDYTRTLYTGQNKPTLENLVDTLATHALLDRKGRDDSQIGFINDFVLGILIGEIICESTTEKIEKDYSFYMLDLACTAYRVQNRKNKAVLWEKVDNVKHKLQPISIFNYDISLREGLVRNYSELSVYDITFFNINFKEFTIENTIFLSCYFKNCTFDTSFMKGISFVDSTFDNCEVEDGLFLDQSKEISTIKCTLIECQILENYAYRPIDTVKVFSDIEVEILKKIWRMSHTKSQHIIRILHCFEKNQHKTITQYLNSLEERDYIQIRGNHVNFNINKLSVIKSELGL